MMEFDNDPMKMMIDLLLLGDDNLGAVPNHLKDYSTNGLPNDMRLLGLKSKA